MPQHRLGAPQRPAATAAGPAAGLLVVALLVAAGFLANRAVPSASPLLWAMGLGVVAAPLVRARPSTGVGIRMSATHLLRAGVALLGLRISASELAGVGVAGIVAAAGTVVVTLLATVWVGRRLRVPDRLALLIAGGSAICGASAIAALNTAVRARDEDVGYAVATVTVLGTAAMLVLPPAASLLGLADAQAGAWAGASIHEVGQATAAGAVISTAALKAATPVKLCRVVLLAPVVALVGRREGQTTGRVGVPGFVLAFVGLVALRSVADLPAAVIDVGTAASAILLAAGLAALGLGVRPRALVAAGARPLLLAVAASAVASATALALVVALSGG